MKVKALTGKISYKNSQNIYVRFQNTHGISAGDTLILDGAGFISARSIGKTFIIHFVRDDFDYQIIH